MADHPIPESTVEALRALLRGDYDEHDRVTARIQVDGTIEHYPRLLAAAMVVLLERRLGPTPTLPDIVSLVARLRADYRTNDEGDVTPLTAEKLIRAGYGDADAIVGLDQYELGEVQVFLVTTLTDDEALHDTGLETLLTQVRQRAEVTPQPQAQG